MQDSSPWTLQMVLMRFCFLTNVTARLTKAYKAKVTDNRLDERPESNVKPRSSECLLIYLIFYRKHMG